MRRYTTYSWDFRTYNVQAQCKCHKCGRTIKKSFSFQCREDVSPKKEEWEEIEKKKAEWLSVPHECNTCKKNRVQQSRVEVTKNFIETFNELTNLNKQIKEFEKKKKKKRNPLLDLLNSSLKGKVLVAKEREWVIHSVSRSWNEEGYQIHCYGIDKKSPWCYCDKELYVTDESKYSDHGNYYWAHINECVITDEEFSRRKELLNA